MSLYLGNNLVSGVATPTEPTRNLGQIVTSTIPLTDAGLHLLDGSLIQGSGIYSAFVTYIADLYNELLPEAETVYNVNTIGSLTNSGGVLSGFSSSNYAKIPKTIPLASANNYEFVFKFTYNTSSAIQSIFAENNASYFSQVSILANGKIYTQLSNNHSSSNIGTGTGTTTLTSGNTYYVKLAFTGSAYKVYLSTTGAFSGEESEEISITSSAKLLTFNWNIGCSALSGYEQSFSMGSIDLNESYINIGNTRWWTGANQVIPCFCTEADWQQSVTDYGVCGKFVYDSVNNTIRLQKFYSTERYLIASFSSGTDWYRIYSDGWCEQGGWGTGEPLVNSARHYDLLIPMANINYFVTAISKRTDSGFYQSNPASIVDVTTTSFGVRVYNNTIYELNWEVKGYIDISTYKQQTQYQYIVIATSTKTDIEVDIDEIATDLNGKADVDLTNCTDVANIKMAHNAMPSDTYEDLTLGSSGATYTAPADGYIYIYRTGLSNGNATYIASSGAVGSKSVAVTGSLVTQNFLPVRKNVVFSVSYSGAATSTIFRFTYAKGSESEAS